MMSRTLALEKFYEKDIVEFLDEYATTQKKEDFKSRINKLEDYLKEKKYKKADNILREYVLEYNSISPDNVYKEINFNKIKKAITLFEEFGKEDKDLNKVVEFFKKNTKDEGNIPLKLDFYELKDKEQEALVVEKEEILYQKKQKLDKIINNSTKELYINMRKRELREAMKYYEVIKKCFEEYPSKFDDEKKELYNDMLGYYVELTNLKKELDKQGQNTSDVDLNLEKHIKIEFILQKIEQIKVECRQGNFSEADQIILDIKHINSKIPDEYPHIKNKLTSDIEQIKKIIEIVKRKINHSEDVSEKPRAKLNFKEMLKNTLIEIKHSLEQKDFAHVKELLGQLENLKNKVPPDKDNIREYLNTKINLIHKKIEVEV